MNREVYERSGLGWAFLGIPSMKQGKEKGWAKACHWNNHCVLPDSK